MDPRKILASLLGPVLLLLLIYSVWFVRYPMWQMFTSVEPIFIMLILSYFVILLFSLAFMIKDAKTPLHSIFKTHGYTMPFAGIGLAALFQMIWFSIALLAGGKLETSSILSLRGYEAYSFYSLVPAFGLYLAFAVFGAFAEEVAFRRYIQYKLARNFGVALSILLASLFFSLEHIQFFNSAWISDFFQTQFIYVLCFGIFVGYFFLKSGEDLWSAFAFHGTMNAFNISLPIYLGSGYGLQSLVATLLSFLVLGALLRFGFRNSFA